MRSKPIIIGLVGIVLGVLLSSVVVVLAGNIDSTGASTAPGGQMFTLNQIYDRASDGTAATKMTTFTEPSSGPGATMYDLSALYTLVSERSRPSKTGQTNCYDLSSFTQETCAEEHAGQDAYEDKGVDWPSPRFTNNGTAR